MKEITTNWTFNPKLEALRVLEVLWQMRRNKYKWDNFPVLFYGSSSSSPHSIWLLDLPYLTISRFWERVSTKVNYYHTPIEVNDEVLVENIVKMLPKKYRAAPDVSKLKKSWEQNGSDMLNNLYRVLDEKKFPINSIEIFVTRSGPKIGFNYPKKFPADIKLWVREDTTTIDILKGILNALIRKTVLEEMNGSYSKINGIVDFLLNNTSIGPYENNCITTKPLYTSSKTVLDEASAVYKKVGLHLGIDDRSIRDVKGMTPSECAIYNLLLENKGIVVTHDDIAEVLFKSEAEFSLYAISKVIQRIRDNLQKNKLPSSIIQTVRGEGYRAL